MSNAQMMTMPQPINMTTTFNVELGANLKEGLGVIGRFDPKNPQTSTNFVGATSSGNIVVHDPTEPDATRAVRHHNLNRPMTALDVCSFDPSAPTTSQKLLLGSPASLLVYDVHNNADVFFREVPDGVNTVAAGTVYRNGVPTVVALVGGNGSVQGFNSEGQESWWTVAGDNVGAVAVVPSSSPQQGAAGAANANNNIAVGTDDFEIRFYQGETLVGQVTETDKITRLVPAINNKNRILHPQKQSNSNSANNGMMAYALANGTIGVYDTNQRARKWRYKSKNQPNSLAFGDVDFDGVDEMLVGWSNGRFEVRVNGEGRSGECVFKETLAVPIAAVAAADYRNVHREMPVVATSSGELHGFVSVEGATDSVIQSSHQLEKLTEQKASLEHELAAAKKVLADVQKEQQQLLATATKSGHSAAAAAAADNSVEVRATLTPNLELLALQLQVSAVGGGGAQVHSVTARADVIFGANDTIFMANHPSPSPTLTMNLQTVKDLPGEMELTVALIRNNTSSTSGGGGSGDAQVLETRVLTMKLPRFAMYAPLNSALTHINTTDHALSSLPDIPQGVVTARISERAARVAVWAQSSFIGFKAGHNQQRGAANNTSSPTPTTTTAVTTSKHFEGYFRCLRGPKHDVVVVTTSAEGELRVHCDNMELASDFIQDIAAFMNVAELSTLASFPGEFQGCRDTVAKVDDLNAARLKLTAEMADVTQLVKALVVKLEDARTLGDVKEMRRTLDSMYEVNHELMGEHLKRSANHTELLASIKSINQMIQSASRLRVGEAKNTVVTLCRTAVKEEKMTDLVGIFENGTL